MKPKHMEGFVTSKTSVNVPLDILPLTKFIRKTNLNQIEKQL